MAGCQILFVDCAGYYDFGGQLLNLILISVLIYRNALNLYQLIRERFNATQKQHCKSLVRKLIVNGLSMIYLLVLLIQILFSIGIFQYIVYDRSSMIASQLNYWYKFVELSCVSLLNMFVLTVGFLYWKALRASFQLQKKKIPFLYSESVKGIFIMTYSYNFSIIFAGFVVAIFVNKQTIGSDQINMFGILNLIGTIIAPSLCIASRLLYYNQVSKQIKLSDGAIFKQKINSLVIIGASTIRVALYILAILDPTYNTSIRNYDDKCLDASPGHAIFLVFLTIVVDLSPPFVFSKFFSSNNSNHEQIIKSYRSFHSKTEKQNNSQ